MSGRFPLPTMRRIAIEFMRAGADVSLLPAVLPALRRMPRGDGHPVLLLPGMGGADASMGLLRVVLRRLGYDAHTWGLGRNLGPTEVMRTRLAERFGSFGAGRSVSLVGWSLGGAYAHGLASRFPERVRCVVTLGSPLRARPSHGVRSTSVYSRSDGVVPYRLSQVEPGPLRENVEVRGGHMTLGFNAAVLLVVADRLAQPEGSWKPFDPSRYRPWFP